MDETLKKLEKIIRDKHRLFEMCTMHSNVYLSNIYWEEFYILKETFEEITGKEFKL